MKQQEEEMKPFVSLLGSGKGAKAYVIARELPKKIERVDDALQLHGEIGRDMIERREMLDNITRGIDLIGLERSPKALEDPEERRDYHGQLRVREYELLEDVRSVCWAFIEKLQEKRHRVLDDFVDAAKDKEFVQEAESDLLASGTIVVLSPEWDEVRHGVPHYLKCAKDTLFAISQMEEIFYGMALQCGVMKAKYEGGQ